MTQFITTLSDVIINPLIRLMFAAALVYFLWGVFQYVRNADSSEDRKTGGRHIIWGLVGLFIMVSVIAILEIATDTFGIK